MDFDPYPDVEKISASAWTVPGRYRDQTVGTYHDPPRPNAGVQSDPQMVGVEFSEPTQMSELKMPKVGLFVYQGVTLLFS